MLTVTLKSKIMFFRGQSQKPFCLFWGPKTMLAILNFKFSFWQVFLKVNRYFLQLQKMIFV